MSRKSPVSALLLATLSANAAPGGTNLGFEDGLNGWSTSGVEVETGFSAEGSHRLDLGNGWIEQTLTGLAPGEPHWLGISYLAQPGTGVLADARILIDGTGIGEIHNAQDSEYLTANGFAFTPAADTATLRIESLESGSAGLLIDDVRITADSGPLPPEESWSALVSLPDGSRQLVNGGFEAAIGNPDTDPDNSGPVGNEHLSGRSLPGWLVTRENVDVIQYGNANPPEGTNALDTSGHGPGGIAQAITGLSPGGLYTFSFLHARHRWWETRDMTGEVRVNGTTVRSLVRTIDQTWESGYAPVTIPAIAGQDGRLTIEVISTVTDKGGSIIYDDFRISEGGDLFTPWAGDRGATPDPAARDDSDIYANGFEFALGLDPLSHDPAFEPVSGEDGRVLRLPISGSGLSQGFAVGLTTSRDLSSWREADEPDSGMTLLSDSSSPGVDGWRVYRIDDAEARLFWSLRLTTP